MEYLINCQNLSENFTLTEDGSGVKYIKSLDGDLAIPIKNGGYIPRSGLFLAETIGDYFELHGKSVLDIGTGETGFLARFAHLKGANRVLGSDLDSEAIRHACQAGNGCNKIEWSVGDVYGNITPERFDFIVSNPPQMPSQVTGTLHDYGGLDGREIILKILCGAGDFLAVSGRMIMLCFDFLGIDRPTNNGLSIQEIGNSLGYDFRILRQRVREVRKGGETEKNIEWIKRAYPRYEFNQDSKGNSTYGLLVVEFQKRR